MGTARPGTGPFTEQATLARREHPAMVLHNTDHTPEAAQDRWRHLDLRILGRTIASYPLSNVRFAVCPAAGNP